MRAQRVPPHRSLVVRLLATSILVAVCATMTTAWLVVQSTTRAVRQEQGRSLSDDTSVYDALLGYGATHTDWSGVGPIVDERAREVGRRITLTTEDRQVIADSADGPSLRAARPSAIVDPLRTDPGLTGGAERIDPRAVGPYRLTGRERRSLRADADQQVSCLKDQGLGAEIVEAPSGRPSVRIPGSAPRTLSSLCEPWRLEEQLTKTEEVALAKLTKLTLACLGADPFQVKLGIAPDFTTTFGEADPKRASAARSKQAGDCLLKSRRSQLKPYVAPPALLFVTDPADGAAQPTFNLSRANITRIATVTGAVLLLAILVTVLVGTRLVRPLRTLAEAARKPVEDQARVPVTTNDEIGYLATALNDLAARRERTEQQRKAMVSDVAHELRTPLTNMRSWLEAAQDGLATADPQLLSLLLEEAVLLQHIIDDLRDLAAADADTLRVHPEPVYVNDALEQVAEAHRGAAETAAVRLVTETEADPQVVVDPVRLRQLVGNLVSNAVRHTPSGGTVTVRSRVADGELTVQVADTGIGIAAADLPRIFDRFWRADGSRTRSTGGSGLGLAIARKLTEAHGGTISVTSAPGAGSTFTVRMPVALTLVP
ncbi:two-component sensor histidine kinase [Actinoplanes sp. ATCC 53533]|uniref:sensor histidine kinase n=1 Tax=Actinoplanes sp. ATCC 53533 TaxID=1288362 RepID=UPI000F7A50F9|nr:HAMP domain-containing sensor histidine kinase [Actinoplanes sp. ATCC 53533]RSM71787.1 two-component sensor histidine kinase [Actinoplanes sp. ATCC 53533]